MGQNLTKITICLEIQKVNNPGLDLDLVAVGQQHLDLDLVVVGQQHLDLDLDLCFLWISLRRPGIVDS